MYCFESELHAYFSARSWGLVGKWKFLELLISCARRQAFSQSSRKHELWGLSRLYIKCSWDFMQLYKLENVISLPNVSDKVLMFDTPSSLTPYIMFSKSHNVHKRYRF